MKTKVPTVTNPLDMSNRVMNTEKQMLNPNEKLILAINKSKQNHRNLKSNLSKYQDEDYVNFESKLASPRKRVNRSILAHKINLTPDQDVKIMFNSFNQKNKQKTYGKISLNKIETIYKNSQGK
jgi:hypothetical protein